MQGLLLRREGLEEKSCSLSMLVYKILYGAGEEDTVDFGCDFR